MSEGARGPIRLVMNENDRANAYLRTKVMSATPAELRLMLMDGAIRFAAQAKDGLEARDYERSYSGFQQARAIVLELTTSVKPTPDPTLAERVKAIYTFIYTELVEASLSKDAPRVQKVIELLEYERETWVMLMEKVEAESRANPGVRAQGGSAPRPIPMPAAYSRPAGGLSYTA